MNHYIRACYVNTNPRDTVLYYSQLPQDLFSSSATPHHLDQQMFLHRIGLNLQRGKQS